MPPLSYYAALICSLAAAYVGITAARPAFLILVVAASAAILTWSPLTLSQKAKILALLPLGLASLLSFLLLPPSSQSAYLPLFTSYITFAVLANVFMMVFVPTDGTKRAWACRFACTGLTAWLVRQCNDAGWSTVAIDPPSTSGAFLFTAVSAEWITAHAIYRAALVTLPAFDWARHVGLEPASLTLTTLLYHYYATSAYAPPSQHPWERYFGLADTLAAPLFAAASSLYDALYPATLDNTSWGKERFSPPVDAILALLVAGVGSFAWTQAFM
ncbi:hypothetical protein M427DRAFT_153095 [Gonapodya prolifera JEL478]|uniref:Uncharacterized protein n=1 Tax=Gonapodya prolifera (strain JEL478) TaxID=1344416 RepID=A0A139AQG8_GONPJ|nr:hypothetical protein M427DRAFT_153095 [Gonapodya prolifera JEL478]|eukprot:KXS18735.1 hypothetical protein M427DRAFT_153095 [Gonapodya prolifera JEL478]